MTTASEASTSLEAVRERAAKGRSRSVEILRKYKGLISRDNVEVLIRAEGLIMPSTEWSAFVKEAGFKPPPQGAKLAYALAVKEPELFEDLRSELARRGLYISGNRDEAIANASKPTAAKVRMHLVKASRKVKQAKAARTVSKPKVNKPKAKHRRTTNPQIMSLRILANANARYMRQMHLRSLTFVRDESGRVVMQATPTDPMPITLEVKS